MTHELPFPNTIDATMLEEWNNCHNQFKWARHQRLKEKGESIHLIAGAAFHRGLEVARDLYWNGQHPEEASIAAGLSTLWATYGDPIVPEKVYKTWDRVATSYVSYFEKWPLPTAPCVAKLGERYAVEFNFAIPIEVLHPQTGNPIVLAGRVDWIAVYNDALYTADEKLVKGIGANWANEYDLRGQFFMYEWAARQYGINVMGTVVRGVACLKEDIKHAQVIVMHKGWEIDRWYQQTEKTIHEMIDSWKRGEWEMNYANSCTSYGGCPFRMLCRSPNPSAWFHEYEEEKWDPLAKNPPTKLPVGIAIA